MNVGENIRKYREEAGLTQKGLADQLFVTPQAISRWEKGEVEPSLDALRSMSEIFNVSVEVLINGQPAGSLPSNAGVKEEQKNETPKTSATVVATPNQLLGVCVRCGRAIYENEEHSHGSKEVRYTGRGHHHQRILYRLNDNDSGLMCSACTKEIRNAAIAAEQQQIATNYRQKRKAKGWAIFMGVLTEIIVVVIGSIMLQNNIGGGIAMLCCSPLFAYALFAFMYVMVANNTFVSDMFFSILEFGFVKMPGVIFDFSASGFAALIALKIIFGIAAFIIFLAVAAFSLVISAFFAMFAFPYSYKNEPIAH